MIRGYLPIVALHIVALPIMTTVAGVVLGLVCAPGCSSAEEAVPRSTRLAREFTPSAEGAAPGSRRCEVVLERAGWTENGPGLWSSALAVPALFPPPELGATPAVLLREARAIPAAPGNRLRRSLGTLRGGVPEPALSRLFPAERPSFVLVSDRVYLFLEEDGEPPGTMHLEYPLVLGRSVNGVWRFLLKDLEADGIPVSPGSTERLRIDFPAASVLRFRTAAARGNGDGRAVRFVVRLDGEILWERRSEVTRGAIGEEYAIALPPEGRRQSELCFQVKGPPALTAFLCPRILPLAAERHESDPRPNIALLVADTYRADNLAAWGGDPAIARRLNRLAERSRRFLSARAPATWTLPSLASLFSGLYPPQCGISGSGDGLGGEVRTLAEHLHEAGYRTVAITDGGMASWRFGLAQGFEWFEQNDEVSFARTLEAITRQLAGSDGRPLFLFVHSYRAHDPYRVSDRTSSRLGDDPAFHRDWDELLQEVLGSVRGCVRGASLESEAAALAELHVRYRGGSADTDLGFGAVLARLEDAGLEDAVVVFTSDHGESFGEHGVLGHGSGVWDDQALVPLLLRAPGLAPGEDRSPASLIDLAPTLAALAGLEPWPGWWGRNLLSETEPGGGPVFSFMCREGREVNEIAVVAGDRKLILTAERGPDTLLHAYEVAIDPEELHDRGDADWARRLAAELRAEAGRVFVPVVEREAAAASPELSARLQELGYTGE